LQDKIKELWEEQKQKLNDFLSQELNLNNIITEDWIDFEKILDLPMYEFLLKIRESNTFKETENKKLLNIVIYNSVKDDPNLTSEKLLSSVNSWFWTQEIENHYNTLRKKEHYTLRQLEEIAKYNSIKDDPNLTFRKLVSDVNTSFWTEEIREHYKRLVESEFNS